VTGISIWQALRDRGYIRSISQVGEPLGSP
jgi:hypothetical protein